MYVLFGLVCLFQMRNVLGQRERRNFNTSTTSLMVAGEEGDWETSSQEVHVPYVHTMQFVIYNCVYES